MNRIVKAVFVIVSLSVVSGCSLYQSEGREFLEKTAFQFSNQGLSITIVDRQDNCVETEDLTLEFFESDNWELVVQSHDPDYSLFEDRDPGLYSMVVAHSPHPGSHLFVCEYLYSSHSDLEQNQSRDLQHALQTVQQMLQ